MAVEINEHVSLTITESEVGVERDGFGVLAVLSCNATFPERSREYRSLAEASADGFTVYTPEYRAIRAALAQRPRPKTVKVIRAAGKPTLAYRIDVATVASSYSYNLTVNGPFAEESVTVTSDSSATNDEIADAIVTALNAISGNNYLAATAGSVGSLYVTVTADAAGDWFSIAIDSDQLGFLKVALTHAVPGTAPATDLDAINLADPDWYFLVSLYNSDAYTKAVAAWAESNEKCYLADVADTESATLADGGGDLVDDLQGLGYARTSCWFHTDAAQMMGAAVAGRVGPTEPGAATFKFKTLNGVTALTLTTTQRDNLRDKSCNAYTTVGGKKITWEGVSTDGDFIDNTRNVDWLYDDQIKSVYEVLQGNDIVQMDDPGIALIENAIRGSLDRAVGRRILLPGYTVTVPRAADISPADRAARRLTGLEWEAQRANAVHGADITGSIST